MLSFIYRLVCNFRKEHGEHPNQLYLNQTHLSALREQMGSQITLDELVQLLEMEIILSQEAIHPHVAWVQPAWQRQAV
jgi:hypothetical protein